MINVRGVLISWEILVKNCNLSSLTFFSKFLPENHPDRGALTGILQKTCDALLRVYAFARGAHKGYLDKKYLAIAYSAFEGIIKELITVDEKGLGPNV